VRRKLLLIAAAAGLASGCGSTEPAAKQSACGQVDVPAAELGLERTRELTLCLLNQERARQGVAALRYDARLEAASQAHSDDMVRRGYFEHDTPEGVEPYQRMLAAGYAATNAFTGENLARGEGSESAPIEILDSWMHSPSHREALLHPGYAEVGIGVAFSPKAAMYTTDFGGPPIR
jgi:uncharacterized protein YkwD